jgi:hypothetical protein
MVAVISFSKMQLWNEHVQQVWTDLDSNRIGQKLNKTKHSEGIPVSYHRWLYSLHISQAPFLCLYSPRFTVRKANKPFSKTDTMFFKKYGGHSTLSRKLRELRESVGGVLAHTFSQSHAFSQFERKCADTPHTFSQIARKRAFARKRGLTDKV